jgi:ribosome biogenesis GTPase A
LPLSRVFTGFSGGVSREGGELFYSEVIDFPTRPEWRAGITPAELDRQERAYFDEYLQWIYTRYDAARLNYFEHNLEVWRQLWRVLEMSDIVLVLSDIRHPIFHFPPSLYSYVTERLRKPMILVLNKCDLVPKEMIPLWVDYFTTHYPSITVVPFTNYPRVDEGDLTLDSLDVGVKIKRARMRYGQARGVRELLQACGIALSDDDKIGSDDENTDESASELDDDDDDDDSDGDNDDNDDDALKSASELLRDAAAATSGDKGYITVGLIGHPNVGKSSIINSLKKKKVVSTSRTPGHTKHFQTIFLTPTVRLCDSPGLVFPALDMPKSLQVLCGLFPIAQTREPYSAVGFLAERVPTERVYGLRPVDTDDDEAYMEMASSSRHGRGDQNDDDDDDDLDKQHGGYEWTAWDMCEAHAKNRNYTTKRGRFDVYRAGNEILRDCLDGVVLLYFAPPREKPKEQVHASKEADDAAKKQRQQKIDQLVDSIDSDDDSNSG